MIDWQSIDAAPKDGTWLLVPGRATGASAEGPLNCVARAHPEAYRGITAA